MVLDDGTHHSVNLDEPEKYEQGTFEQTTLVIDPESVFPRQGPMKGYTEMTIAELQERDGRAARSRTSIRTTRSWRGRRSTRFRPPASPSCWSRSAWASAIAATAGSPAFVLGIGVVFVYWVLMYMSEAIAKAGLLPYWFAWLAMWVPNIVVALWGLVLIVRKLRAPEQSSMRFALPFVRRRARDAGGARTVPRRPARGTRVVVVIKIPHIAFPRPSILDWYVLKQGLRVSVLAGVGTARAVLHRELHRSVGSPVQGADDRPSIVLTYLWWASPQFAYYLVPLAVLMGALVTIGALTKNTELVVMKACGISLYRAAAPLLILAIIGSAILLGLEEGVLAVLESPRRRHQQRDSRTAADGDRSESTLGDGEQRQYLPISVFRVRAEPVERPVDLRVRQGSVDARAPQIFLVRDVQRRSRSERSGEVAGCERMGARLRAEGTSSRRSRTSLS